MGRRRVKNRPQDWPRPGVGASFGMGIRGEKEGLGGKQKTAAGLAAAWGSASPATGARKKR